MAATIMVENCVERDLVEHLRGVANGRFPLPDYAKAFHTNDWRPQSLALLLSFAADEIERLRRTNGTDVKTPASIEELDALLNSEDDSPVTINPDGSITVPR